MLEPELQTLDVVCRLSRPAWANTKLLSSVATVTHRERIVLSIERLESET